MPPQESRALWTKRLEWFLNIHSGEAIPGHKSEVLHGLLDRLWQAERKDASPEALDAYAKLIWGSERKM
jgi:hypothetical protein